MTTPTSSSTDNEYAVHASNAAMTNNHASAVPAESLLSPSVSASRSKSRTSTRRKSVKRSSKLSTTAAPTQSAAGANIDVANTDNQEDDDSIAPPDRDTMDTLPAASQENINALEELQGKVALELTAIRTEREKQKQQLQQLVQEYDLLNNQREIRQERHKLEQQRLDMESIVEHKAGIYNGHLEELEQLKTRYQQLKRTLQLLQGGVESILERSATDSDRTEQGIRRAKQRVELLHRLLKEEHKSQLSLTNNNHLQWDASGGGRNLNDDNNDHHNNANTNALETIPSMVVDTGNDPIMFADKKKRYDSIDSMMSQTMPQEGDGSITTNESWSNNRRPVIIRSAHNRSNSTTGIVTRVRSKSWDKSTTSGGAGSQSGTNHSGSRSGATRKGGRKNSKSASSNSTNSNSLMQLLEQDKKGEGFSDNESADTPKTTNTNPKEP